MKILNSNLYSPTFYINWNGWVEIKDTWTYASSTTINVPSGAENIYNVGNKIRIYQSAWKYFYIADVASSLLTLWGGDTMTVANADIEDPGFSIVSNPFSFPANFPVTAPAWTTNGTAFTNQPENNSAAFSITGRQCRLWGGASCHATSGGTGIFTATFTAGQMPNFGYAPIYGSNDSTGTAAWGRQNGTNTFQLAKYDGTTLATNSQWMSYTMVWQT